MKKAFLLLSVFWMSCAVAVEPEAKWTCPDCTCSEECPCGCSKEAGCQCKPGGSCQCGPKCQKGN